MSSPNKNGESERRKAERRATTKDRRSEVTRSVAGDRREVEQRGVAVAMVDALEDILKWERASERVLKAAAKTSSSDLTRN
jgi:hypothetical protein